MKLTDLYEHILLDIVDSHWFHTQLYMNLYFTLTH